MLACCTPPTLKTLAISFKMFYAASSASRCCVSRRFHQFRANCYTLASTNITLVPEQKLQNIWCIPNCCLGFSYNQQENHLNKSFKLGHLGNTSCGHALHGEVGRGADMSDKAWYHRPASIHHPPIRRTNKDKDPHFQCENHSNQRKKTYTIISSAHPNPPWCRRLIDFRTFLQNTSWQCQRSWWLQILHQKEKQKAGGPWTFTSAHVFFPGFNY